MEYRITSLPMGSTSMCTMALILDEPMGPPRDFVPQLLGLTLSVNDAFLGT